ncbi:hypothetical protein AGABI1DRAFT_105715 [Agaricus bisporus var. burnettii JB137-S8]|uniref:Phosphoribulokinase/uridine kinase domain-containing protein n=1 Tax=Agaricus bisporus var. burnettii (strain JB137-S8 / ATCC MYA-4627 / FGSC 10392) TaxID=597362 RepID=K5XZC5_AGABU|nr:uncharacterized protein AGABI1DRAFT_105715 [Agaricus bisporus var. burnettii JB137-S8]EKM80775.1 hypothetical protein AGABI1DRAFT_105715 [Agaricus bisporus var. burnettii JB137-S8]
MSTDSQPELKVVFVGIGGATCSGKTTLAKHLRCILPDSVIIHQDDFAPPQHLVPIHPVYQVQDWDAPAGAISWDRLIAFLRHVRETGDIPLDHHSHDHLNEQQDIPIPNELRESWITEFKRIQEEKKAQENGVKIIWALVDGFLLYWHKEVIAELGVRVMLRVPHDVLKRRRHERHGYHTAVQSDPVEGSLWRDPPHYWEQIVYPAYLEAHREAFVDGDVEHGRPNDKVKDLILLETLEMGMGEAVERCCRVLRETALKQ